MRTTISTKGQIVLPAAIRKLDGIEPGQELDLERVEPGEYRLTLVRRRRNAGLVKLLASCPEKGWFEPLQRAETTESGKPVPVR